MNAATKAKPQPSAPNRPRAIMNEAARLVVEDAYEPGPAILTAMLTVPNTSPGDKRMARVLWTALVNRIRKGS